MDDLDAELARFQEEIAATEAEAENATGSQQPHTGKGKHLEQSLVGPTAAAGTSTGENQSSLDDEFTRFEAEISAEKNEKKRPLAATLLSLLLGSQAPPVAPPASMAPPPAPGESTYVSGAGFYGVQNAVEYAAGWTPQPAAAPYNAYHAPGAQ
eukprot:scaffold504975_cov39-Prasinocladus_malaysianus.AAC.1